MIIDPIRTLLWERAERAGCRVEPVRRTYIYEDRVQTVELGTRIFVDGKLCVISRAKAQAADRRPGAYTRLSFGTLTLVDAVIFYAENAGWRSHVFVVPARTLRDALFADSPTRSMMRLFVPAERGARTSRRIDLWQYEDAWHLLRGISKAA